MTRRPLHLAVLVLALPGILCAAPAWAAPLRPQLLRGEAGDWKRIPPEPEAVATRSDAGPAAPAGAVTRSGRRWNPHPRVLVILVDFQDRPADPVAHPPAYYQDLLFSENVMEHGSLREWYRDVSYGRMHFSGEVFGWFRMPRAYADYAGDHSGICICYPSARTLVGEALDAAVAAGVDFRGFDNDGPDGLPGSGDDDGILDVLAVVFAGYGAERTAEITDIRSHYWDLPGTRTVDGVTVPDYIVFPERENVGVAVHEMGHALGAEDLYDQSLQGAGLGDFSVMAYNFWLMNGLEPGGPDPYTRMLWGLAEPDTVAFDEPAYPIPDIHDEPKVLLLWTGGEPGNEYFLVENRRAAGYDRLLAGDGLLVYHVDLTQRSQNDPSRYRVAVVQADGLRNLDGIGQANLGDAGDYFPGRNDVRTLDDDTTPGTLSNAGNRTRVALRDIGNPGPVVTAAVGVGRFIASAPIPELEIRPEAGTFAGDVEPGPDRIRLVIRNRGTRLAEGRLQVFSRDPRVQVTPPLDLPVEALGVRGIRAVAEPVSILVSGRDAAGRDALPLEVRWVTGTESYDLVAPLPLAGTRIAGDGFESDDPGTRPVAILGGGIPWRRQSQRKIEGGWAWGTPGYGPRQNGALELAPFILPEGVSELHFQHLIDTESMGDYGFDGGFLEASTDGGNFWFPLEPRGGYPGPFLLTTNNPYGGRLAWWGSTDGWEEVVVPLPMTGETRLRFHFVSDYTGSDGLYTGWFVDALVVRTWSSDRAGVVETVFEDGELQVGFSVLSLFPDRSIAGGVTLVREAGLLRRELGHWPYDGRLDGGAVVRDPVPGAVERYWLRWDDPGRPPAGPFLVAVPGAGTGFFARTPGLIHRGDGGRIGYNIPGTEPTHVRLDLFDAQGRLVTPLVDEIQYPGFQEAVWPGRGATGRSLAAGVYFLRASTDRISETRRIVLLP